MRNAKPLTAAKARLTGSLQRFGLSYSTTRPIGCSMETFNLRPKRSLASFKHYIWRI